MCGLNAHLIKHFVGVVAVVMLLMSALAVVIVMVMMVLVSALAVMIVVVMVVLVSALVVVIVMVMVVLVSALVVVIVVVMVVLVSALMVVIVVVMMVLCLVFSLLSICFLSQMIQLCREGSFLLHYLENLGSIDVLPICSNDGSLLVMLTQQRDALIDIIL